jgi:hypothetical protein
MIGSLLLATLLSPTVVAHEQKTLTVILTDEGVVAGNVTDLAFVQGNSVWFRMEDSTNNTTMVVQIDTNLDGVFNASDDFDSGELVNACELDENGSLVDETCAVSATHQFMQNATVGTYLFWVHRNHNGSQTVWNHSITVNKDVHEEDGPSPGDCFGVGCDVDDEQDASAGENSSDVSLIPVLAVTSLVGMVALALSIRKERIEQQGAKAYLEEE